MSQRSKQRAWQEESAGFELRLESSQRTWLVITSTVLTPKNQSNKFCCTNCGYGYARRERENENENDEEFLQMQMENVYQ